jgi:hypothetical protein
MPKIKSPRNLGPGVGDGVHAAATTIGAELRNVTGSELVTIGGVLPGNEGAAHDASFTFKIDALFACDQTCAGSVMEGASTDDPMAPHRRRPGDTSAAPQGRCAGASTSIASGSSTARPATSGPRRPRAAAHRPYDSTRATATSPFSDPG